MSLELYEQAKPVWREGILALLLGAIMVSSLTSTDISFHGDYVLIIESWCHPDNQDGFCTEFREQHNLGMTDQSNIGNKYWDQLLGQALSLFAIMFIFRMAVGWLLQVGARKKIRITTVLIALVWGASASTLFMFGVLDTLYFVFQGQEIPDTLQWLNGAGIFTETKTWFGDATIVEKTDLFATNLTGIGILLSLVLLTAFVFKENGYKTRGIA